MKGGDSAKVQQDLGFLITGKVTDVCLLKAVPGGAEECHRPERGRTAGYLYREW